MSLRRLYDIVWNPRMGLPFVLPEVSVKLKAGCTSQFFLAGSAGGGAGGVFLRALSRDLPTALLSGNLPPLIRILEQNPPIIPVAGLIVAAQVAPGL
jgi:hypothetical protein